MVWNLIIVAVIAAAFIGVSVLLKGDDKALDDDTPDDENSDQD